MGFIESNLISEYENDDDRCDARPTNEIGALETRRRVELMRIGWNDSGTEIVFHEEIKADVSIVLRPLPTPERTISVWRFEVEAPAKAPVSRSNSSGRAEFGYPGDLRLGDDVIVADASYRSEWIAPPMHFKPAGPKRPTEEIFSFATGSAAQSVRAAQSLAFDPWNSSDEFMTASFIDSAGVADIGSCRRGRDVRYLLSVCTGRDRVYAHIRDSAKVKQAEAVAKSGKLLVGPRRRPMAIHLVSEVDSYIQLSILQAMAGPSTKEESRDLRQKPVADLAVRIFEDHMSRLSRRRGGGPLGRVLASLETDPDLPGAESVADVTTTMRREDAVDFVLELMKDARKRRRIAELVIDHLG